LQQNPAERNPVSGYHAWSRDRGKLPSPRIDVPIRSPDVAAAITVHKLRLESSLIVRAARFGKHNPAAGVERVICNFTGLTQSVVIQVMHDAIRDHDVESRRGFVLRQILADERPPFAE